jgi:hypothetical protein
MLSPAIERSLATDEGAKGGPPAASARLTDVDDLLDVYSMAAAGTRP